MGGIIQPDDHDFKESKLKQALSHYRVQVAVDPGSLRLDQCHARNGEVARSEPSEATEKTGAQLSKDNDVKELG